MENKDNIKILLMLYQQHPCLYVTKCAEYHNRMKRDKALQIICEQYTDLTGQSLTVDIAKRKINNLRSQYLDQINKIKQSKSSGASSDDIYKPTWWLFEDMSFLNPHISQRKGESSIMISNTQSELLNTPKDLNTPKELNTLNENESVQYEDICNILNATDYDNENINPNVELPSCSNSSTPSSNTSLKKRKRTVVSTENCTDKNNFWAIAFKSLQSVSETEKSDGIKHWILYIESELRKITDPKKLKRIQRKIINLVDDEDSD